MPFDLLGDDEGTRFFSKMATAAYNEKEGGHTGNYFSYLWGPLGVRRAGPAAVAAFMKEQRWYYDLARRWDGQFTYQGWWDDSYTGNDMTGPFLLAYALPLHKLYITGKDMHGRNELSAKEVKEAIEDGRDYSYWYPEKSYDSRSEQELLKRLASWSPTVRFRAASSLSRKTGDVVCQLSALLRTNDLDSRLGACEALEHMGTNAAPAVDDLARQLDHSNLWLRIRAVSALGAIGQPARKVAPAILRMAAADDTSDPLNRQRRYICMALPGLLGNSLEGIDRQLLYPAVRKMLTLDDGDTRGRVGFVYNQLSEAELEPLWPDILRAASSRAPSGEMSQDPILIAGLELMAKHHVKEGIPATIKYAKNLEGWGAGRRSGRIMSVLKSYGAAARDFLPELKALVPRYKAEAEDAIKSIEQAKDQTRLRTITPQKAPR